MCSFEHSNTTSGSITAKYFGPCERLLAEGPNIPWREHCIKVHSRGQPPSLMPWHGGWHAWSNDPNSYTSSSIARDRSSLPGGSKERSQTKFRVMWWASNPSMWKNNMLKMLNEEKMDGLIKDEQGRSNGWGMVFFK